MSAPKSYALVTLNPLSLSDNTILSITIPTYVGSISSFEISIFSPVNSTHFSDLTSLSSLWNLSKVHLAQLIKTSLSFNNLLIPLFLAALSLHCCVQAFSWLQWAGATHYCGVWLLIAVALCCRAQALGIGCTS